MKKTLILLALFSPTALFGMGALTQTLTDTIEEITTLSTTKKDDIDELMSNVEGVTFIKNQFDELIGDEDPNSFMKLWELALINLKLAFSLYANNYQDSAIEQIQEELVELEENSRDDYYNEHINSYTVLSALATPIARYHNNYAIINNLLNTIEKNIRDKN